MWILDLCAPVQQANLMTGGVGLYCDALVAVGFTCCQVTTAGTNRRLYSIKIEFYFKKNKKTHMEPNNQLLKLVSYLFLLVTTLCLKKAPTFKLSVTLSNLNLLSKFLHCTANIQQIWKMQTNCILSLLTLLFIH